MVIHQDYRREGEAARTVDRLARACRAADELLDQARAALQGALRSA